MKRIASSFLSLILFVALFVPFIVPSASAASNLNTVGNLVYLRDYDVDKKLRDLCDGMFLHTNFMRVFTLGKRITRKVVIVESTAEAESRISENLAICPPWEWTLTYIPRWAKYFDSHAIPDMPKLEYREDAPDGPVSPPLLRSFLSKGKDTLRLISLPVFTAGKKD